MLIDKKCYIFDLDGTLYSLVSVHKEMLLRLALYYIKRPWKIRDLFAIFIFRRYRENIKYKSYTLDQLYLMVGDLLFLEEADVKRVINKWMFSDPLELIVKYKYRDVLNFIKEVQSRGKKVAIYSDYPTKEKLYSLEINADFIFSTDTDINITELKPSKKVMDYIVKAMSVNIVDILYVGDRVEKDGCSAELVNVEYMNIQELRKHLKVCE